MHKNQTHLINSPINNTVNNINITPVVSSTNSVPMSGHGLSQNNQNITLAMIKLLKKVCTISSSQSIKPEGGSINQSYLYNYNKSNQQRYTQFLNYIHHILNHFFGTFFAIINKPVFLFTQNKLTIHVNYFMPKAPRKLITRHIWKFDKRPAKTALELNSELTKLIQVLSKLLNLKVELVLNQLKYPYMDSQILAKFIALNTNQTRFRDIFYRIANKALTAKISSKSIRSQMNKTMPMDEGIESLDTNPATANYLNLKSDQKIVKIHRSNPAILTGIKVQISGRLMTERVKPKLTINKKEIGGFKKTQNNIVDYSIYTNKNKRGAYTVKVWTTSTISS